MFTRSFSTDVKHKWHGKGQGAVSIGHEKLAKEPQLIVAFSITCCILRPTNVSRGTNDNKRGYAVQIKDLRDFTCLFTWGRTSCPLSNIIQKVHEKQDQEDRKAVSF